MKLDKLRQWLLFYPQRRQGYWDMALLGTSRNKQSAAAFHPPLLTKVFQGLRKNE